MILLVLKILGTLLLLFLGFLALGAYYIRKLNTELNEDAKHEYRIEPWDE